MRKQLLFKSNNRVLGELGLSVGNDLHVGDVVSVIWDNRIVTNVICKNSGGNAFVMGLGRQNINEIVCDHKAKKVIPYKLLTNELLKHLDGMLVIKETPEIEMTISEIEEKLGYKIKVIS